MPKRLSLSGRARALAGAALCLGLVASGGSALAYRVVAIGASFDAPVQVATAPGEADLLFVVEAAGRIQVLRDGKRLRRPFLDISDIVLGPPDSAAGGEQGLLSVAFAPDYEDSGLFYVAFTNGRGDVEVGEFRRSEASRLRADPESRRKVLSVPHRDAQNHNGGQLQFGPDGLLYISIGDGGATPERAPDLSSLLGKILRIDPRRKGKADYRIPKDNPFARGKGRDEIFAYGLRNPWRFSFAGERIAIADVGQGAFEEINLLSVARASGANFGWPEYEAFTPYDDSHPGPDKPTFPVFAYDHTGGRCSIIGGYVARDPGLPKLAGKYLYGDYCSGEIFALTVNGQEGRATSLGITAPQLSGFGVGEDGQVYIVQLNGTVSRLEDGGD